MPIILSKARQLSTRWRRCLLARAHYVRVSDPRVDRIIGVERRVTAVASVSSQDPLYYWYEETICLLNGTAADATDFAFKKQKKIQGRQKESTVADADVSKKRKRDDESIAAIETGKDALEQLAAKLKSHSLGLSHEEMQVDVASSSWPPSLLPVKHSDSFLSHPD